VKTKQRTLYQWPKKRGAMKDLTFGLMERDVLRDLYICARVGDLYILGGGQRLTAMANVNKKLSARVLSQTLPDGSEVLTPLVDGSATVLLEDAEFGVLKECVKMVCEDGVNPGTATTRHHARMFSADRALAVLEFMDAVKPYTMPEPEKVSAA
jgi:hypothetical protein